MKRYIMSVACMATMLMSAGLITSCEDIDPIQNLQLDRVLSPTDLTARIRNSVNIELTWNAMENAASYTVEVYQGTSADGTAVFTQEGITGAIGASSVTYTVEAGLLGETEYFVRVKAVGDNIGDSKWVDVKVTTAAEQIFTSVAADDLTHESAVLRWTSGLMSSADAGNIVTVTPTSDAGANTVTYTVTADDVANGFLTISGLTSNTEYTAVMKRGETTRGTVTFKTNIDTQGMTPIEDGVDLATALSAAEDGEQFVLMGSAYSLADDFTLSKSVSLTSIDPTQKATITFGSDVKFTVAAGEKVSLTLNNLILDGTAAGSLVDLNSTGGSLGALALESCEITGFSKQLVYTNNSASSFDSYTIDNCVISGIGTGGDGLLDWRNGTAGRVSITNTTIKDGCRTFVRIKPAVDFTMTNCTLYNVSTVDNSNNNGLFQLESASSSLTVRGCLFYGVGLENPASGKYSGCWARASKMKVANPTYANNYYYACPNFWVDMYTDDHSAVATETDPQFVDAEAGDLTVQNQDILDNQVGDPRWLK